MRVLGVLAWLFVSTVIATGQSQINIEDWVFHLTPEKNDKLQGNIQIHTVVIDSSKKSVTLPIDLSIYKIKLHISATGGMIEFRKTDEPNTKPLWTSRFTTSVITRVAATVFDGASSKGREKRRHLRNANGGLNTLRFSWINGSLIALTQLVAWKVPKLRLVAEMINWGDSGRHIYAGIHNVNTPNR